MPAPTAQPRSQPRSPRILLAVLVAALLGGTAACGDDGPTAAEAGATLAQDGRALLTNNPRMTGPKITDAADKDVPCGKNKAKRIFAATASGPANSEFPVDVFEGLTEVDLEKRGYEVDLDAGQHELLTERVTVLRKQDPRLDFRVTLRVARPNYEIRGETACLRTG